MRIDPGSHLGLQTLILFVSGVLLVAIAITGAPFFFDHPKARGLTQAFGRGGARFVCGVLGLFLAWLAYWVKLAFR